MKILNNIPFLMGGCRIQQAIKKLGYPYMKHWYYIHNVSQAIQACKFLRGEIVYPTEIYEHVSIFEGSNHPKMQDITESFEKANVIFLEIQTLKNIEYCGYSLNAYGKKIKSLQNLIVYEDTKEILYSKLKQLESMVKCPIVYVPHVYRDEWIVTDMPFLSIRKTIEELLIEFCSKNNCHIIIPSTLANIYGDDMFLKTKEGRVDPFHYSDYGIDLMSIEYGKKILDILGGL